MDYTITPIVARGDRILQPVGTLRFDAGSLSLNLLATVARRYGEPLERLDSLARLRDWLHGVGLPLSASLSEDDLARLRELREHLNELFRSMLASRRPRRAAVAYVNAVAANAAPELRSTRSGVALALSKSGPLDPILALIASDAIRILAGSDRLDLRVCAADDCRMLYLASGRRARRWCSSERCGNRSRVAAHRARAAARAGKGR
jgi:predicted RNA-binding Zn ribbon-like protein